MTTQPTAPASAREQRADAVPLRADAARNLERIVEAAAALFSERGLDVSTSDIAERAEVGEATIFRRFPTKQDLIGAVVELKMEGLISVLEEAGADPDPARAFERMMSSGVQHQVRDLSFHEAVDEEVMRSPCFGDWCNRLFAAIGPIVARAQAAGAVRDDIAPEDIPFLIKAVAHAATKPIPGLDPEVWRRYLGIVLDGLSPEGATKLDPKAPTRSLIQDSGNCQGTTRQG